MPRPTRARPALEPLDDRSLPATVTFGAGVLSVSNPTVVAGATNVLLSQEAANTFAVYDNFAFVGQFSGVRGLRYAGGPARDTINVLLNGYAYNGPLALATGADNDIVEFRGNAGSVGRGLAVNTGPGNDTVHLSSAVAGGGVFLFGPVRVTDPAGTDAVTLGNAGAPSLFLGDVTLRGMNTVRLAFGQPDVFRNLAVTTAGDPNPLDFATTNTPTIVTLFGNLRLTGGPGDDDVLDSSLLVTGNAVLNLGGSGAGGNDVTLWPGAPPLRVNGNLTLTSGSGADELYLSGYQVGGNMTVNLGGGGDTLDLSTLTSTVRPRVGGNLTIRGGNETVNFEGLFLDGVTAVVGGDFTVALGSGLQRMRVANAPDGVFRWTSGAGDDSLTFIPATAGQDWDVRVRLGGGDDTFHLDGGGLGQSVAGWVDFGGDITGDTYIRGANWTEDPAFRAINLP